MTILYYTGHYEPPEPLKTEFDLSQWRNAKVMWPEVIRVYVEDELIYPIYPPEITPDTYKVTLVPVPEGRYRWVMDKTKYNSVDIYATVLPHVNVGTIGHVDYARLPRGNRNKLFLQRSEVLHPGYARATHWFTSL